MDVIRKIQAAPAEGQNITPAVRIISAHRKNTAISKKKK
jgi:hypothetical protein